MKCARALRPLFLSLGCCLVAMPNLARAEDGDLPPTSEFFEEYDANADGCVTADEFRGSSEIFKLLDKDRDGSIRPDELGLPADYKPNPRPKRRQPGREAAAGAGKAGARMQKLLERLAAMDADKDGRVSKAEFKGPEKGFDRLDRNKDGFLDAQDRRAAPGADGRPGMGAAKGRDRDGEGLNAELRAKIEKRAAEQFARLDANGDGKLTTDEVPSPMLLEVADANGDGAVTLSEMQKILVQRAMRQAKGAEGARRGGRRGRINPRMLASWDRDKDGKVSAQEFPGRQEMFARLDRDGDGFLTKADLADDDDAPAKKPGAPATGQGGDVIQANDTDGDGRLHRGEFRGSSADWERLDRNRDGWITRDELQADPGR